MSAQPPLIEADLSRRGLLRTMGGLALPTLSSASAARPAPRGAAGAGCAVESASLARLTRPLDARAFGLRADGSSDDAPALQLAVDAGHAQRRPVIMPAGVIVLGASLLLQGRDVTLIGAGIAATTLRAGRTLPVLLDAQENDDKIISPLVLSGMRLDGANRTDRNLAIRLRHHTYFDRIDSVQAKVGFWERDCWLSRRFGCRTGDNGLGWHLVGANHSSLWEACTFTACEDAQLRIGSGGTANDGNDALLFRNCDVEFGRGMGVDVAPGVTASFEACYLGEGIGGDVLRNRGAVTVREGSFFFGGGSGVGVRPLGGQVTITHTTINGQGPGAAALVNLTEGEARASGGHGRARFDAILGNLPLGGLPLLNGDPLDRVPLRTFAARLGRDWRAWSHGAAIEDRPAGPGQDGRTVTGIGAAPPGAWMGLAARLTDERWRGAKPPFIACVYQANQPTLLRLSPAAGVEPSHVIATLPVTQGVATALVLDTPAPAASTFAVVELVMAAAPSASLTLHELTLADGVAARAATGGLGMLGLAQ